MIDRLMRALEHSETIHNNTDYSTLYEGDAQRLYNEGIIHGMKNALISAMHHIESLENQRVYAKLVSELNHKEDRHKIDVSEDDFLTTLEEIELEGRVSGFEFMTSVAKDYVLDKDFNGTHVLSLTK